VGPDDFALRKDVTAHRFEERIAIGSLAEAEGSVEGENLEVVVTRPVHEGWGRGASGSSTSTAISLVRAGTPVQASAADTFRSAA
jgi:hypothetical protein